jgi:ParB family transcriptional regulator, chromosome partitioning protein
MAIQKRNPADLLKAAKAAGTAIEGQDRQSEVRSLQAKVSLLPLPKIIDRVTDTRELKAQHVEDLMVSISVLGLLEPLVVDSRNRLLAGGHRKMAIHRLKEQMFTEYSQLFPDDLVPVRVLDFDADRDPDLALQVEVAENEQRRDYTRAEVRKLAERLRVAGYSDNKGRPAAGSKPLRPALTVIIGKNIRTVQRYLNEPEQKSQTNVRLSADATALTSLKSNLVKWQKAYGGSDDEIMQSIDRDVSKLLKRLEAAMKKSLNQATESIPISVPTTHGSTTYAEMAVQEQQRVISDSTDIIDVSAVSSSQVDLATMNPIFDEIG